MKKLANRGESLFVKENPVPSYLNIGEPIFKIEGQTTIEKHILNMN